jgi:anti-sigma factor RsiW
MSEHLSPLVLNALADGELSTDELRSAKQHLEDCLACSSAALDQCLLKSAVTRLGHRHQPPEDFTARVTAMLRSPDVKDRTTHAAIPRARRNAPSYLAIAAVLLLTMGIGALVTVLSFDHLNAAKARDALMAEVTDAHVAMLAVSQPQVLSSDRHTVKPWFQGKLPFSFNLPDKLPPDVTLTGANLTYLGRQPVAQLIFTIGKHKASVFLRGTSPANNTAFSTTANGFHGIEFKTHDLEGIAVSDVDPARLTELANLLRDAQTQP